MSHERWIMTVRGAISPQQVGIADGHNHLWLSPVENAVEGFVLNDEQAILAELRDYRRAGGQTQIDCQPGGAGRDGRRLRRLAEASDVQIVASTGYHLRKYYPPDYWLWSADAGLAYAYFSREISEALDETRADEYPVRAGLIKIAFEEAVSATPSFLLDAVAQAALETGVSIEIHTEKGAGAEEILRQFDRRGLGAERLILCHMDKRPDPALHRDLMRQGAMLEYDTFFRPKYDPDHMVLPLLERLVGEGFGTGIVIGTDQADPAMWIWLGHGPGLIGLLTQIIPRLYARGFDGATIDRLVGGNIAGRLAHPIVTTAAKGTIHA